ncbi:hypothetical protein EIK77_007343 [Talaromyces pinophilus]|jgi:hypothetical protein|nr:hypothetical protein EIK77_007343 [Talaromyces pinophilus]
MWDSRQPLPDRPDSAYTAALRRRVIQTPLVLEQDHTSHMATDTSQLLHYSPTQLAQDGLPLCSSSHNELYPLTEMSHFDPREEGAHAPTRVAPEVEIQISSPLQSLAAILDKSDLNPETAFNDPTAYYFDARPSSIFQDIAFDDETFYQLFGDGAEAGIDRTSENFASRFRSFS